LKRGLNGLFFVGAVADVADHSERKERVLGDAVLSRHCAARRGQC
jgi:hypothetical protein